MTSQDKQIASFDALERVIADSLRFKRKLAIGEDAYTSMRIGKLLARIWDVGGVAATGGGVAASSTVASTFFASSGWLATFGLGATAATPVGWVIGAAVLSGGAYFGVTRLFSSYAGSRVDVIPKFINTPIDLLGATLFDLMAGLLLKLAMMDGQVTTPEQELIRDWFIEEWGYDSAFVPPALAVIEQSVGQSTLREVARAFSEFTLSNPDCNYAAITDDLLRFLGDVAIADGVLDEREEMAIERVQRILSERSSVAKITTSTIAEAPAKAGGWISQMLPKRR